MSFSDASHRRRLARRADEGGVLLGRGFSPWTLYQEGDGGRRRPPSSRPDAELRGGAVAERWGAVPYGVVAWWGHGSATRTLVGYTGAWDGDLLVAPTAGSTTPRPPSSTRPPASTATRRPRANLGYGLLKRGAIATVAASRVSWYAVGQRDFRLSATNAGLGYRYVSRLTAGDAAGRALALAKGDPAVSTATDAAWMNLMDFNLYGDPSVGLFPGPVLQVSRGGDRADGGRGRGRSPSTAALALAAGRRRRRRAGVRRRRVARRRRRSRRRPPRRSPSAPSPAGLPVGTHAAQVAAVERGGGERPARGPGDAHGHARGEHRRAAARPRRESGRGRDGHPPRHAQPPDATDAAGGYALRDAAARGATPSRSPGPASRCAAPRSPCSSRRASSAALDFSRGQLRDPRPGDRHRRARRSRRSPCASTTPRACSCARRYTDARGSVRDPQARARQIHAARPARPVALPAGAAGGADQRHVPHRPQLHRETLARLNQEGFSRPGGVGTRLARAAYLQYASSRALFLPCRNAKIRS